MHSESEGCSTLHDSAAHYDEVVQQEATFGKEGKEIATVMHTLGVRSSCS